MGGVCCVGIGGAVAESAQRYNTNVQVCQHSYVGCTGGYLHHHAKKQLCNGQRA